MVKSFLGNFYRHFAIFYLVTLVPGLSQAQGSEKSKFSSFLSDSQTEASEIELSSKQLKQ